MARLWTIKAYYGFPGQTNHDLWPDFGQLRLIMGSLSKPSMNYGPTWTIKAYYVFPGQTYHDLWPDFRHSWLFMGSLSKPVVSYGLTLDIQVT